MFREKLKIGKFELANRAFLAPMSGITDAPFRTIVVQYGAGLVVSEMIASASLSTGQNDMVRRLNKGKICQQTNKMPHMVQLVGNEEKYLSQAAKMAQDAGADIIDINFGCPSKKVTNGYAGAALMRDENRALRLIEAVANAVSLPISVKMRLGWDENNINVLQIAKLAQNAGAIMIIVHARTRNQFYKGRADWSKVRPVCEELKIPVIINGDIIDEKSAILALEQSGADGVMIGRAALGQPWIVGQIGQFLNAKREGIKLPDNKELLALIISHYEAILSEYGEVLGVRVARKFLRNYLEKSPLLISKENMKTILTSKSSSKVKEIIIQIFNEYNEKVA